VSYFFSLYLEQLKILPDVNSENIFQLEKQGQLKIELSQVDLYCSVLYSCELPMKHSDYCYSDWDEPLCGDLNP